MAKFVEVLAFFSRPKRKVFISLLIIIWVAISTLYLQSYRRRSDLAYQDALYEQTELFPDTPQGGKSKEETDKEEIAKVKETLLNDLSLQLFSSKNKIKDLRKHRAHSSVYDIIFSKHDVSTVLSTLNFEERCDLYFSTLFQHSPNWYLNPDKDLPLDMRDDFKFADYKRKKTDELKEQIAKEKEIEKDDVKEDQDFEDKMKEKYKEFWKKTQETEQTVVDYVSHLRIYNKCYVTRDNKMEKNSIDEFIAMQTKFMTSVSNEEPGAKVKTSPKDKLFHTDSFTSCSTLENRIYPWLAGVYPVYERWNGDKLYSPPDMSRYISSKVPFTPSHKLAHDGKGKGGKVRSKLTNNNKDCFVTGFKNSLNGNGIVLSIADKHVDETIRQLHLLRALNNKYPIQIVYNDGLSEENKRRIVQAAREPFSSLPTSFHKVKQYFPDNYLDPKDHGLPKQEVWFVNVHNVVQDKYKGKFGGFGNKFLAALFNSFEEYMLVDADTVMVQNPEYFFNLKNYKEKGAFFYKDRAAPHFRPDADCTFFQKITPSIVDEALFNIPIISQKSFNYEFFQGMYYFMESGLVMINRNLHFNSVMMMVQMNFLQTVTGRVYGDKEIFFLAFLTSGEENFYFNDFFAASLGEETPTDERGDGTTKSFLSREICAAHPGHVNGEDKKTLVWFNSGFRFCGQAYRLDYKKEFEQQRRYKKLKDEKAMEKLYKGPMKLRHAIIPPFKNKLETLCENNVGEPKEAWHMDGGYCNSYLWCAYDRIGGMTETGGDTTQKGTFIEFDPKSVDLFDYYGDIWVGNE